MRKPSSSLAYIKRKWGKNFPRNMQRCRMVLHKLRWKNMDALTQVEMAIGPTKLLQLLYLIYEALFEENVFESIPRKKRRKSK